MRKITSILLALAMCLSFSACNKNNNNNENNGETEITTAETETENTSEPILAGIYKDYFLVGNIFEPREITAANGKKYELLKENFNVLTPGNVMKPGSMSTSKGNYSFLGIDPYIKMLSDSNIQVVGHTLVWHEQAANWLTKDADYAAAKANLEEYIGEVAGHYAGQLLSWDVVNEAMADGKSGDWRSCLRVTPFYEAYSNGGNPEDYIKDAFLAARKADPNAKLYYNDYNLDYPDKAKAVANMVKEINDEYLAEGNDRLLIEGVGMQSHYNMGTSVAAVEESLKLFIGTGVEVSITELDITVPNVADGGLTDEQELAQAIKYAELFTLYKQYSENIARVTIWGVDDRTSWRSSQYPLLWNGDFTPKKAYYAISEPEKFLQENNLDDDL